MTYYKRTGGGFNGITALLMLALVFIIIYYVAKAVFTLLYYATPVLLLITLIIDYKIVVNYGKWLYNLTRKNPLLGIAAILLSMGLYPVVTFFLFGKALFKKKMSDAQKQFEERHNQHNDGSEYVPYEDVSDDPGYYLELPPIEPPVKKKKERNEYDDLFRDEK